LCFDCEGSSLVGILAEPATRATMGVVIVVGGPQYRAGSHRQFVLLARALAAAGFACLRFDYRGMGDSERGTRSFEAIDADLAAAIDELVRRSGVSSVVLWGLCDGATAAIMYAPGDPRVAGVIAVNPWARSEQGEAETRLRHYYVARLASLDFWRALVTGRLSIRRSGGDIAGALRRASGRAASAAAGYLDRMQQGWARLARPVLFILSGNDLTAREFENWVQRDPRRRALFAAARTEICPIAHADHTFSTREWRDRVADESIRWLRRAVS
jgi:exosortase A-associated hydrolase 1